jgi:single-strand DNA-binding protein
MNKVFIQGNLGQDPNVRHTSSGMTVANFSVATTETWTNKDNQKQQKTEWHRVVAFGKLAENIAQYVNKGSRVLVEGKITTRQWEKDGVNHQTTEIVASNVQFLDNRKSTSKQEAPVTEVEEVQKQVYEAIGF